METNIQLSSKELIAVSKIITFDTRTYLNNVYVTPNFICASDGIHLCKVFCDTGVKENLLIPIETIKIWSKMVPKRFSESLLVIEHIADKTYSLKGGGVSLPFNVGDGTYPDIDKVIPTEFEKSNSKNRNFQWKIVAKLAEIFTELTGDKYPQPIFSKDDIGILAFKTDRVILILMPLNL